MPDTKYEFHPIANELPLMPDDELDQLAADIDAKGLLEPIWLFEGKVLDGRNRYRACLLRDVLPRFEFYKGRDPVGFVVSKNIPRRHLTPTQRAMYAARLANWKPGDNQHTKGEAGEGSPIGGATREEAAEKLKVSSRSVDRAREVQAKGVPELVAAVDAGEVSLGAAAEVAKLPADEQAEVVAAGPEAVKDRAAEARAERHAPPPAPPPPPPPPVVETRPPPHQTKQRRGKPAAAGVGGEVSRLPNVEQQYGRLVREVEEFARNRAEQNSRSHRESLDLLDGFLSHVKRWNGRPTRKGKT